MEGERCARGARRHARGTLNGRRLLPLGPGDFSRQVAIWLGFAAAYELVRAFADRGSAVALANAGRVVAVERSLGGLPELTAQRWAFDAGAVLLHLVDWTYWLSQFVVLSAALLWVYLRRHAAYMRLRNTLFVVNTIALVGYVAFPTAPPRLLPGDGFVDTLTGSGLSFGSGLVGALANPYAAMPSVHAADALVLGVTLAAVVQPRALQLVACLWPLWVAFALMATGNHFLLDIAVGFALGALGILAVARIERRRGSATSAARRNAPRGRNGAPAPHP